MKVGVAQIDCRPGAVEDNVRKIVDLTERAGERQCNLVIFPEMCDTGYDMEKIRETASTWSGYPYGELAKTAKSSRIYLVCGISEREDDKIYNTMVVLSPDGECAAKYRKIHLAAYPPLMEDKVISAGNSLKTVDIDGMTFGLQICYDIRFPEVSRSLALSGAGILLVSSAWPFPRLTHWETILRVRAIENQAYVVAANRVGSEAGVTFCGSSRVIGPYGVIASSAAENREELLVADIEKDKIDAVRENMPIFRHRRPDTYGM